jgi:hypothetical protein
MAIDKLSIYNSALLQLGQEAIGALTDDRADRYHIDAAYDLDAVAYCLQVVAPSFATKSVNLTTYSIASDHSLNRSFNLPSDFISLVGVYTDADLDQPLSRFLHEGHAIKCEYTSIYVRYVSSDYVDDYSYWTPSFANVVSTYLARQAAVKVDATKFEGLNALFVDRVDIAKQLASDSEPKSRSSATTVTLSNEWRQIYNDALLIMGLEEITSNTDDSNRRTKLDRALDASLVMDLLEDIGWGFAHKSNKSYYDPNLEPGWGYDRVHQKPQDMARLKGIYADEYFQNTIRQYIDENGYFYCNYDEIYIEYVSTTFLNTPSQWPAFFRRLVAGKLAKDAAKSLRQEGADYDRALMEYEDRRSNAMSNDAVMSPPKILRNGSWVRARTRKLNDYRRR